MTPVKHNLSAIKGEYITLTIGYNGTVEAKDNLTADESCRIILSLDTNELHAGRYAWDLFIWAGSRPIKCLIKGQLTILEGVSNRGK